MGKLAKNAKSSTRLEVIPCGTPIPTVKANWENKTQLKVMYAGRMVVEQKQILKLTQAFLEASALAPRLQFSIYGEGDKVKQVQQLLQPQDKHNVIYKGAVSPSEIISCFQEHQVFTLMSDYEGMPVALMEAMACGLVPVCLEESSGINEIIEHGFNGFIVKDRHQDYQRHLQLLLDDPELWQKLSNNTIKTIEARYSSAKTHQQWFELLNSYSGQQATSLKTPRYIKLEGELLHYGDNRKPDLKTQWHNSLKRQWLQLRLFMRPRARIRAFFNK
jgi:glycosyltransferase involved in cell wall biosynthesis